MKIMRMIIVFNKILLVLIRNPLRRAQCFRRLGAKIGNDSMIFKGVSLGSEPYLVEIGNHVKITADVKFVTHDGGIHVIRHLKKLHEADIFGKIVIGDNVFIGVNSIILPDVTIGDNCIIGAHSVVTKNIPDNSVVVGIPARVIGDIESYYANNEEKILYLKGMRSTEKRKKLIQLMNENKER